LKIPQKARTGIIVGLMIGSSILSYRVFSTFQKQASFKPPAPLVDTCIAKPSIKQAARKDSTKPMLVFKEATLKEARKFLLHTGRGAVSVDSLLSDSQLEKYVLFKKPKPDTSKVKKPFTYERYKELYHYDKLLEKGIKFQEKYSLDLAAAQDSTGTPEELVTAVHGIETIYAGYTGELACVNVFLSLMEDSRAWKAFAKRELSCFLQICDKYHIDPFSVKGSERGAFTPGQFLPSSFLKYDVLPEGTSFEYAFSVQYSISLVSRYLRDAGASMHSGFSREGTNYKAAFAYNHSGYYARFVVELASDLKKHRQAKLVKK